MRRSERKHFVEDNLRHLLIGKFHPQDGYTNENLTKIIWSNNSDYDDNYENFDVERFRRESKYIERRLGAIRHEVYHTIWEELKKHSSPLEAAQRVKPEFLPFALPVKRYYWTYFNAIKKPYINNVIKQLYKRSEGMDWVGRLLEGVFGQT